MRAFFRDHAFEIGLVAAAAAIMLEFAAAVALRLDAGALLRGPLWLAAIPPAAAGIGAFLWLRRP